MPVASTLALLLSTLGLLVLPPQAPATPLPRFRLTLLPLPPGLESSSAIAINERGQVVGAAPSIWESASVRRAAFWQDGTAQPVLATGPGADHAIPTDVDDAGLVIGNAPSGVQPHLPFTWLPGQDLQSFDSPLAGQESFEGLNARGAVVGWAGPDDLEPHPYLFAGGVTQELGVVPGDSVGVAFAISDVGWIVGISGFEAARWRHGVVERLDVPGSGFSAAMAVNDRGVAVGRANIPGVLISAVVWHGTTGVQLPALAETVCTANAINDDTWIVGVAHPPTFQGPGETGNIAVLWLDGQVYDLNALTLDLPANAELDSAADVNDAGQIVGDATVGGVRRAFLLEPIQP